MTIRADYFDRPLASPAIGELMATRTIAITPLSAEEIELGPWQVRRSAAASASSRGCSPPSWATSPEHPAALPFLQGTA